MPRTYLAGDTRSAARPFLSGSLAPSRWERVGGQNGLQSTGRSGRTGFHVTDMPSANHIRGRNGVLLADPCQDGMEASLGTAIAGSPNLFMLVGPNTGLGHTSMVIMIEAQVAYIMDALQKMAGRELATVEVRPEVRTSYNDHLQTQMEGTVRRYSPPACVPASAGRRRLWGGYVTAAGVLGRARCPPVPQGRGVRRPVVVPQTQPLPTRTRELPLGLH